MLLILTGMMGTGKSSIGPLIADALEHPFMDIDQMVCRQEQKSIAAIFEEQGEAYFRNVESAVFATACREKNAVVATGGGTLCNDSAWSLVPPAGVVVWLKASPKTLQERLIGDTERPLLQAESPELQLRILLEERLHWYGRSDIQIDTDTLLPKQVAERILQRLEWRPA